MRDAHEQRLIKLKQERIDENRVHRTWHQQWIVAMARNMTEQCTEYENDIQQFQKNKNRYSIRYLPLLFSDFQESISNICSS